MNDPVVRASASVAWLYRAWGFALLSAMRAHRALPASFEGRAAAVAAQLASGQAFPGPSPFPKRDLGAWLEGVVRSPVLLGPPAPPPSARASAPLLTTLLIERFGAGAARPLREGARAWSDACKASQGLLERVGPPEGPVGWPEGPDAALAALHGALRALACQLALVRWARLKPNERPVRAQVAELAEAWAAGSRAFLALLASLPGADVPEDVVPARERIDLRRIDPGAW
jgi:hypothetical protein